MQQDLFTTTATRDPNAFKVQEIKCHVVRETALAAADVRTPSQIAELWGLLVETAGWYQEDKEHFVVFMVDAKNRLKALNLFSLGLLDASLIHPREVFRPAIGYAAAAIVVAHNHPSGDAIPSAADIRITRELIEAGNIVDIKIMDHVILGKDCHSSLREDGLVNFNN